MKIVTPELANPVMGEALKALPNIEPLMVQNLVAGTAMLKSGEADTMIAGLDYSSRDVLLAYKDNIPLVSQFFSSCFICEKAGHVLAIADGGVNKIPDQDKLYTIVEDTVKTFTTYTGLPPKIAMLSYSTKGSGGENPDLAKIYYAIQKINTNHPDWQIDGEMQLDAAINPAVASKKIPNSPVAGQANILIVPDLNSGNILYKSLEQFGGFTCAGPIIQGFEVPLADLSRGSSPADVILTLKVLTKLLERK
ncbi:hypothetical protein IJG89_01700 [Candidatus Saccharibacteria bacterium]|nr:hypothetical protein [Candidatus Saccharibacteria bacterium]